MGGVRKSIHQSRLAKGLICWGFKVVQEEIPRKEASTLQIGSGEFPPGQWTSRQLHPCHRLFEQYEHQDSSSSPYSLDLAPCDFWLFPKLRGRLLWDNWRDERGCDEDHWHAHTRGLPLGPFRGCWNSTTSALQPEEITSKGTRVSCVYYQ